MMRKTIENLKSGNYEVVDNQGVSVTSHFVECLEKEFFNLESRTPKFKLNQKVYAFFTSTEIYKGQIDAFDYYTNTYLIFPNEDIGNEWIPAHLVFKTKEEAKAKLRSLEE